MDSVKRFQWPTLKVEPLNTEQKGEIITEFFEKIYGKTLSSEQRELIKNSPQTDNPLYLRTLLDEVSIEMWCWVVCLLWLRLLVFVIIVFNSLYKIRYLKTKKKRISQKNKKTKTKHFHNGLWKPKIFIVQFIFRCVPENRKITRNIEKINEKQKRNHL